MSTLGGSPNILLFIADDLAQQNIVTGFSLPGHDVFLSAIPLVDPDPILLPKWIKVVTNDGAVQITGTLPGLSILLRNGVYFKQAWAQPSCSPTRASIYTGLHPWKSGVGNPGENPMLDPARSYTTLPELLPSEYVSGLFGKWHLAGNPDDPTTYPVVGSRPTDVGWDKHFGTLHGWFEGSETYDHWYPVDSDNGYVLPAAPTTDYATRRTVKEAGAWINAQDPATPWFVTIAFHTPHEPFHIPPHGYDTATVGNQNSDAYKFNVMVQNMSINIERLLGIASGGGDEALDFEPISQAQLRNTVIIFMGDNGSPREVALEEEKTFIYEGSVRVPLLFTDGNAVVNELQGQAITPRFLHATRLNTENQSMAHAVDLYMTITRLADPAANGFPSDTDSKDLSSILTTLQPPTVPRIVDPVDPDEGEIDPPWRSVRNYNFSQWYTDEEERATIRNSSYKLNYDTGNSSVYSLYRYENGEIPNREDDGTATDLYADATSGADQDALDNLNALLDELIDNHRPNETESFPDPRPF